MDVLDVSRTISVVVASFRDRVHLSESLASLEPQCGSADVELIVPRPTRLGDLRDLAIEHPRARFVGVAGNPTLPIIRGAGLAAASGTLVALTEDHCVADAGWVARLRTHVGSGADLVGGAMDNARRARYVDWGAFFAEYGFFAGPSSGEAPLVTGANVAYARSVVEDVARWALDGAWENVIHARLAAGGAHVRFDAELRVSQALTYDLRAFCGDRYQHGFDYARARLAEERPSVGQRLVRAASTAVLPPVLAWRIGRTVSRPEQRSAFLGSLPFTLTFLAAWSLGELIGYVRGPAR